MEAVVFFRDIAFRADLFQDLPGPGPLEGQLGHLVGDVGKAHVAGQAGGDPLRVLFVVAGVDHQQILLRPLAADHQIVHDAALLVAEHGVLHLAVGHFGEICRHQPLEILQGVGPLQQQLRHVGHVEQSGLLPHRHVLSDDAGGILDRHQIPAEGHHFAAQGHVGVVEGSPFFHMQRLLMQNKKQRHKRSFSTFYASVL